jgi:hypothetical protein
MVERVVLNALDGAAAQTKRVGVDTFHLSSAAVLHSLL